MIDPMALEYLESQADCAENIAQSNTFLLSKSILPTSSPIEILYSQLQSMEGPNCFFNVLANHQIKGPTRAKMISWMIEVLSQFHCEGQSFFLAISYFDRFLAAYPEQLTDKDIHLLGIVCMFIACKMQESSNLTLKQVYEKIAAKKFSVKDILQAELKILATISYDLVVPTPIEFLGIFSQVIPLPLVVNRTAEIILILWQHYENQGFSPSEQAASALIIACTCLNMVWLVPRIFQFSGYNELMLKHVMDEMYKGTINFSAYFPHLRSCMTFLRFEIVKSRPGPLFIFLEPEMANEQSRLLATN